MRASCYLRDVAGLPGHIRQAVQIQVEDDPGHGEDDKTSFHVKHLCNDYAPAHRALAVTAVTTTALIGIDWGTSALRAYRFGADGTILERRSGPQGILEVRDGGFEAVFEDIIADWPACPVVISGMITSRQGWVELPYLMCPAPVEALARALHRQRTDSGRELHFVTGLAARDSTGIPDVMRGEETMSLAFWSCPAPTASGPWSRAARCPGLPPS
jgi:hypothetical protein